MPPTSQSSVIKSFVTGRRLFSIHVGIPVVLRERERESGDKKATGQGATDVETCLNRRGLCRYDKGCAPGSFYSTIFDVLLSVLENFYLLDRKSVV